jgi:hypothetical protein
MGKYYDDKKEYAAARYYYGQVAERYPNSELSGKVRERLAQISEKPDSPPERLAWLVGLFPENRERTRVARIPELQNKERRLAQAPAGENKQ